jgi:hypothetical protein
VATPAKAWRQVGEQFDTLGTQLRKHFDEVSAEATTERAAFEKALRALLSALEDGFGTAGKAVRDPALRENLNELSASLREALLSIFEAAGDQVRERISAPIRASKTAHQATTRKPSPRKTSSTKSSK